MAKSDSFETNLKALEKVVEKLESGGGSLEEALSLFEEGRRHAKACSKKLNEVERKIQTLLEDEQGHPVLRDMEEVEAPESAPEEEEDFPK
ncbi:MAG: exodeoxyribonuclease VII small subunit [Candidatus Sumerlaeota bacterium]|nr:exodeoxyribonuclease VII small subunit [Candidatus Sumerlaeota bacterium]